MGTKIFEVQGIVKYTGKCPHCNTWYDCSKKPTDKKFKCPGCGKKSKVLIKF